MILDEEVFAVIVALSIIASAVGIATIWRPEGEGFTAIGLLDESCRIGLYPKRVLPGGNLTLCISVFNYMGRPIAYMVTYKIALNSSQLPTNTTPSSTDPLATWVGALSDRSNRTFLVGVSVPTTAVVGSRVALVFELWILESRSGTWVYSGRWVHLWVQVGE
ncbi:MAG: DUF1616 domain-containing protein [Desulfurococcaceae archaeon]|nr:DUF1616 domain-containing protein [Desulfurococcaceae archaeon]